MVNRTSQRDLFKGQAVRMADDLRRLAAQLRRADSIEVLCDVNGALSDYAHRLRMLGGEWANAARRAA